MPSTVPIKNVRTIVSIPDFHQLIHEARAFNVYHLFETVAPAAEVDLLIVAASREVHVVIGAGAGGAAEFKLYENAVASNNGTVITPINRNRYNPLRTKAQFFHTPTLSGNGAMLDQSYIFAASKNVEKVGGGGLREEGEWVLHPGKVYLVKAINRSLADIPIIICLAVYEYQDQ